MDSDFDAFTGQLLKIVLVNELRGDVHARRTDGQISWITFHSGPLPEVGDVILFNADGWEQAPPELWLNAKAISIVRHVRDDGEVFVDDGLSVRGVPNPDGLPVKVLNTIEYDERGITRIIAPHPLPARGRDAETDIDVEKEFQFAGDEEAPGFDDFGGYPEVVARARQLIDTQMLRRNELKAIGARPVKGVLFTGPPGTGKTHLARIIARESRANFYLVSGPSVVSKWLGDSEETLRKIFETATNRADNGAIIFFDEIDSIAERRSGESHEASRRLVAQLLTLMDGFDSSDRNVVVIAATNRADALDPALTRPGRFDWEIEFGMPGLEDRYHILVVGARRLTITGEIPFYDLAQLTEGWSAAELSLIWSEAALLAAEEKRSSITAEDVALAYERTIARPRQKSEMHP